MVKMKTYYVTEKQLTDTENIICQVTTNGKPYILGICVKCGRKKSKFIKKSEIKGNSF